MGLPPLQPSPRVSALPTAPTVTRHSPRHGAQPRAFLLRVGRRRRRMLGSGPRGTTLRLVPSSLRDGAAAGRADLNAPETKRSRRRPRRRRNRGGHGVQPPLPRPPGRGQQQQQAPGSAALGSRRRAGGIGIGFLPPHPLPAKLFRVGLRRAAQAPQRLAASCRPRWLRQRGEKYSLIVLK